VLLLISLGKRKGFVDDRYGRSVLNYIRNWLK